ncbi:chromosome partitioning protein, ParB family [Seinonella peptonophila]|uniref:Chromosome partitioning protein, ParB family n=1 Tax=Seinonella peptonophila TaxID=112248 RepID=A0A1M4WYF1_9BACL|nr:ParB/RepB/Spo0J family partition protein [Seinonella peptonophila]SHE86238.1 chromosome partitioning protein, ParB family [Seinonella peptonophila]
MGSKGLGKGLGALLPDLSEDETVTEVSLSELRPNPYQPRKQFDEESLQSLSQSMQEHGLIQPLVVRQSIHGYEIVVGERRFRAAELAKIETLPVVVRECDDRQMMEIALIENLQREDLNPIEVANAYQKLMQHFSLTQEELSDRVGRSRPHVANFLRLLQLPPTLQEDVSRGTLSMGHARALLGIKEEALQRKLAEKVKKEQLSVRELEEWVQKLTSRQTSKKQQSQQPSARFKQYEDLLQEVLSTPVRIRQGRRKGKIEIEYYSEQELERLIEYLNQNAFID